MEGAARVRVPDRPRLSQARVRELLEAAQSGDKSARDELVESNLKLVLSVVRRFAGRGADMDDLFQVGCLGLIRAVERFDLDYEVSFSTYAVPVIIGEIRRYLQKDHPVKVGRGLKSMADRAREARHRLTQSLGRSPTPKEIAEEIDASTEEVIVALDAVQPPASLEEPIHEDQGRPVYLKDRIVADDEGVQPIESLALAQLLRTLDDDERELVRARYILGLSQTAVAERMGCSQAHVSRMERRLLLRMRRLWEG